jgi:hypothetical protein
LRRSFFLRFSTVRTSGDDEEDNAKEEDEEAVGESGGEVDGGDAVAVVIFDSKKFRSGERA